MKIHLLSGFLGSGKTTAIQQASRVLLQQGVKVGVITNDQGVKLVDSNFFNSLGIPGRQVINGCFCCNYDALEANITSLVETTHPDVIFAESVGSCTDIVATVMKPLMRFRPETDVTTSTFADARLLMMLLQGTMYSLDDTVTYIYYKQLEESGIIVVNKMDLMSAGELAGLTRLMNEKYPDKTLIFQNSLDAFSLRHWLRELDKPSKAGNLLPLEIDYDIYGAGEAKLAWFDQELEIFNTTHSASKDAVDLIDLIYKRIVSDQYAIGHLKFLLNEKTKISFTSALQSRVDPDYSDHPGSPATLLINARVQTEPDILSRLVTTAIADIQARSNCTITVSSLSAFQPGYPRPTHRITL